MNPKVVFAVYRPKEGKHEERKRLIARHVSTLKECDLVTDRPPVVVQTADGTFIEIFEWKDAASSQIAHEHPRIAQVWEAMAKAGDSPSLSSLKEAGKPFPHFDPVTF